MKQHFHHDPSAFFQVILGGKCAQAGIGQDRSGLVENTVPLDTRKFRETQTGIFGRMEPAQGQPREVNRNFRNEFPENVCSIRF